MFKNKSKILGVEVSNKKNVDFKIMQKSAMSYSKDKTVFDLIDMESHHKCVQVCEITKDNVFFKYVSFTTSQKAIRLGF